MGIKLGDLVLSIVERCLIQCPFIVGSSLRGFTVLQHISSLHNSISMCITIRCIISYVCRVLVKVVMQELWPSPIMKARANLRKRRIQTNRTGKVS